MWVEGEGGGGGGGGGGGVGGGGGRVFVMVARCGLPVTKVGS